MGVSGLVAHENVTQGRQVLKLPKVCVEGKVPPSTAIGTWCPQALEPPPLKDWFLSSPATRWVL